MTTLELAAEYRSGCLPLQARIRQLRQDAAAAATAAERICLDQRAAELTSILRETREVAFHMEHYYDRRHRKNAKFTF